MSRLAWQIKIIDGIKALFPFCEEAETAIDKFKMNQPVTSGNISGTRKERSLKENNLYFKACAVFKEMIMPDNRFAHASVDMWFRYRLGHIDHKKTIVTPDGVHFQVLPLNFIGCEEAVANRYYNKAFQEMADMLMMDKEEFLKLVKSRMGTR